jgi:hypothetical protein
MGFTKTDGGDSSKEEVFSNSVDLVDIHNTELLPKVLHTGIK